MTHYNEFSSYHSASQDQKLYLQAKGYQHQGYYTCWEPVDYADVEPTKQFGPGACVRGELDDFDWITCEEF